MTFKFKVGDRVKVVNGKDLDDFVVGDVGVVVSIIDDREASYPYYVEIDRDALTEFVMEDNIELNESGSDYFHLVKYFDKPSQIMVGSSASAEMTLEQAQQAKLQLDFCINEAGVK